MTHIIEKNHRFDLAKVLKIIIYDTIDLFYDGSGATYTISFLYFHAYGRLVSVHYFFCEHMIFRLGIL